MDATSGSAEAPVPVGHVLAWSLVIGALATVTSVLGLVDDRVYAAETDSWTIQARGQDLGNLLAVATLLAGAELHRRGSYRAGLVWLGTLLYFVYAFLVYAMAVHFNALFLAYVATLGVSSYAVIFSVGRLRTTYGRLHEPAARRLAAWTCLVTGVLFALLWLGEVVPATLSGETPESIVEAGLWVNPIHVIDLAVLLPGLVIAGVDGLRGGPGRFFLAPLLAFSVLMGSSIVATMVLMVVDGADDAWPPLVLVAVLVLVSLVALGRYLHGACEAEPRSVPR